MHVCCVISIKYDDDDDDDDDHIYKIIATVHTQSKCHTFLHSGPGKNFLRPALDFFQALPTLPVVL